MNSRGLLLASGGIDSITAMYEMNENITHVLFFNYGQAVFKNEYECVQRHTSKLKKTLMVDDLKNLYSNSKSSIFTGILESEPNYEIPNRNLVFINYAVAKAVSLGLGVVYTGIFDTGYSDTSTDMYKKLNEIILLVNHNKVRVNNRFENKTKAEILKLSYERHKLDLGRDSFSCYLNSHNKKHCGICSACVMRQEAYKNAGIPDTTEYLTDGR
jgi:7-cyano-7-deazaguanine synthase